jgi:hypothetical protein
MAPRPEHHGVARGHAPEGVARWVSGFVGLGLDDAPCQPGAVKGAADQHVSQQGRGDLDGPALEERSRQPAAQEPSLRRKRSSFVIGQALMTSRLVTHPRCAVATPNRIISR